MRYYSVVAYVELIVLGGLVCDIETITVVQRIRHLVPSIILNIAFLKSEISILRVLKNIH